MVAAIPVLSPTTLARRARLRRLVAGVIGFASVISIAVIGKAVAASKRSPSATQPVATVVEPAREAPAPVKDDAEARPSRRRPPRRSRPRPKEPKKADEPAKADEPKKADEPAKPEEAEEGRTSAKRGRRQARGGGKRPSPKRPRRRTSAKSPPRDRRPQAPGPAHARRQQVEGRHREVPRGDRGRSQRRRGSTSTSAPPFRTPASGRTASRRSASACATPPRARSTSAASSAGTSRGGERGGEEGGGGGEQAHADTWP